MFGDVAWTKMQLQPCGHKMISLALAAIRVASYLARQSTLVLCLVYFGIYYSTCTYYLK